MDFRSTHDFVLSHALKGIEDCSPFFICVIGSSYGPHCYESELPIVYKEDEGGTPDGASSSAIKRNLMLASVHGHSWVADKPYATSSILQLEVEHAALRKGSSNSRKHCYFYFQDSYSIALEGVPVTSKPSNVSKSQSFQPLIELENEEAQLKLSNLKRRLITEGYNVRFFTDSESLNRIVVEDWTKVIGMCFEKKFPSYVLSMFLVLFVNFV